MKLLTRLTVLWPLVLSSSLLLSANSVAQDGATANANPDGILDRSYPELQRAPQALQRPANGGQSSNRPNRVPFNLGQIRREVRREQTALEKLNGNELQNRAQRGERAAQIALGVEFAKEAALLSFAPTAANAALSDALRWYSLAAKRGYPGALSLDLSGIRYFPVRVTRAVNN